jgi:CheY-like chemotaxis protein
MGNSSDVTAALMVGDCWHATACSNACDVIAMLKRDRYQIVFSDIELQGTDGIAFMRTVLREFPESAFVAVVKPLQRSPWNSRHDFGRI